MGLTAALRYAQDVRQAFSGSLADAVGAQVLNFKNFSRSKALSETSTPPITKVISQTVALVAGSKVIDLTAALHFGANVDLTGLKLQDFLLVNDAANLVTIEADASNGYLLFGTAGKMTAFSGGGIVHTFGNAGTPAVDATHKNIKLTGTGTQQFFLQMLFG
jgi:hypothetical protein